MQLPFEITDLDRRIWHEELDEFVPSHLFDAHTHIYRWAFYQHPNKQETPYYETFGRDFPEASWALADACDAALFPGRKVHRLAFPMPFASHVDFTSSNAYLAEQGRHDRLSAGLMLVHPGMTGDEVERDIEKYGFLGFKPYRFYARSGDAANCRITEFMPEHQIEVANRHGLIIMMHLSKPDAIADPENLADLESLIDRYPRVRWILAHCARSYSCWAIEKAGPVLRRLPQLWFDTSSVCESDAFDALYSTVGIERVMYGSDDIPIGLMRGKYVAFGFAWAFLSPKNQTLNLAHCDGRMTFTRYEQLRAMRRAAQRLGITPAQNQALFFDTAMNLVQSVRSEQARDET
ncbi:amidohydrolase family protein [Singulisphaera sp. Ch08]|uniref:Amidohydrolase family protein n=1 Tax=Singulisphaera sp. Ch08 TaxID=3120278 RepID=A0AAU7CLD9_9BACT